MKLETLRAALNITTRHAVTNPKLAASMAASLARLAALSAGK